MIPGRFTYHRPGSVGEAVKLLASLGEEARPLAGGHSLIPMMKLRLAQPEHLVDLGKLGLKGIRAEGADIVLGAITTQAEIIDSALLRERAPILQEAAQVIADPQVRYQGTIGGNVANGDPGNDMPGLMLCLDARYSLTGANGSRQVAARDFYEAAFFTKLQPGEILTEIRFAAPAAGHGWAYEKLKRKIGDYAVAAAAVVLTMSGGKCNGASIALTNVAQTPLLAADAAKALIGTAVDDAAIDAAAKAAIAISDPTTDTRGPVEYRRSVLGVMVRRAIARAKTRAR
ncbi:MAG: Carbon monoxide dehydrogenase medium chain [Chloroflexi bacterium ADurb.Bin325]|nr:MAG: Carbon monoxide dehydrogenase medium chain [Chloroflexi bacterium ADurb.Bin325]